MEVTDMRKIKTILYVVLNKVHSISFAHVRPVRSILATQYVVVRIGPTRRQPVHPRRF